MKGLWGGVSLSQEAPWKGPRGGLLSPRSLKDVSERCKCLYRGPFGESGGNSFSETFERWLKGFWGWSVSLHGSSVKGTWRGAPSREPLRIFRKVSGAGISLLRGSGFGKPGRGPVYQGL
jgi:hypothetical protein